MPNKSVKQDNHRPVDGLANHQVVTLAVYMCGGASRPIDSEDVAVKVNELAPGRYTWRKYTDQISLDAVSKGLWDAQSSKKGFEYLTGSEREGWMLTAAGLAYAEAHVESIRQPGAQRRRISVEDKRWLTRERDRLADCAATTKFNAGRINDISLRDAEQVFRLDDYVTGAARKKKINRLINLLGDDATLGPVVLCAAQRLKENQS